MGGRDPEGDRAAFRDGPRESARAGRWTRLWPLRLTLLALLVGACGGEGGEPPPEVGTVAAQLTVPAPASITITYPASVNLAEVPILGNGLVRLNDGVKVYPAPGASSTTVVNVGTSETNLGVESKVAHVRSKARVVMRDRAWATGSVVSSSSVQLMNGAHADGGVKRYTPIPMTTQTLTLPERGASRGPINLEPDRSLFLEPGTYDDVSIKSRSTLRLRTGLYQLKALTFEPQANLVLDDADGPVELFLTGTFTFRGTVTSTSGPDPKLFIVDTSPNQVTIDAPFRGTIIAPNARLAFISTAAGHYGTFFGKDVEVQPSTPIYHRPPDWAAAINGPSHVTLRWMDGSAILRAADPVGPDGITDGHVTLPELISFKIPRRLRVTQGNAGNHTALFRYRDQQDGVVTCTYRGGSSLAAPVTPLDLARGLTYRFVSCTNGAAAGTATLGKEFWLTIDGIPAPPIGYTMVELHLDGCGGTLDPPLEPEESAALAESFSWATTSPLPERDAQGRPTLYYALIYIEDHEQLGALDDAYIHYDPLPLFTEELDPLLGQCGTVDTRSDGEGLFVFTVLPGQTYNLLRQHALTPDPETGDDRTIFDVVVLKTPPPGAANPDGSLSYRALTDAGFLYRGQAEPEDLDEQQQPRRRGWLRRACRNLARGIGQVVRAVVHEVQTTLGAAHNLIAEDCNLTMTLNVDNRDAVFDGEMKQAWGLAAGAAARPRHVKVDIRMLAFLPIPLTLLPTLFSGITDSNGDVTIKVPRNAPTRHQNPVCIYLDNYAATITDFLLPARVCDFGSRNEAIVTSRGKSSVTLVSDHHKIHMHTALTDANQYFRDVTGYEPHQARVLTGWLANYFWVPDVSLDEEPGDIVDFEHPAWAGCLGLNQREDVWPHFLGTLPTGFPLMQTVAAGLGAATTAVSEADIVMPDKWEERINSRGVIVHEYGHFALCSLLHDSSFGSLPDYLMARIDAGNPIDEGDDVSILSDAFADFVASQVVGGVDYLRPSSHVRSNGIRYCASDGAPNPPPCLEGNATGLDGSGEFDAMPASNSATAPGYLELARVLTTWHDAFDGHYTRGQGRRQDWPGNSDYYSLLTTPWITLPITTVGWAGLGTGTSTPDDENVHLAGGALRDWGLKWGQVAAREFTIAAAMRALTEVMLQRGVTWCDACNLFTLHEDGAHAPGFWDRWMACAQGRLGDYVGPAPDSRFNMRASDCSPCDLHQHTNPLSGNCETCWPGAIAVTGGCIDCPDGTMLSGSDERCVYCPPHTVSSADHTACLDCAEGSIAVSNVCTPCEGGTEPLDGVDECTACPEGEVSTDGICQPCELGTVPNATQTACVPCPLDESVPYNEAVTECSNGPYWYVPRGFQPGPDACGSSHDLLLTGLQSIPTDLGITVTVLGTRVQDCQAITGWLAISFGGPPAFFPFRPTIEGQGCRLTRQELGEWVREFGLDEARVSVISDSDVELHVSSGFCVAG